MSWRRLADLILRAPGRVLLLSIVVLATPALGLLGMTISYDQVSQLPEDSDSVRGFRALSGSFGPGQVQPVVVVAYARGETIWTDDAFAAIDQLTLNLEKVPGVAAVRSITRPSAEGVSQEQLEELGLTGVADLAEDFPRAIEGLGRAIDGLELIRGGLEQIRASVPEQRAAVAEGLDGIRRMRDGLARIIPGLRRISAGLGEARRGVEQLAVDIAEPALRNVEAAWQDLKEANLLTKTDPQYEDLARHIGEALGLLSGRCPDATGIGPQPPECPAGQKIDPEYDGLAPSLRQVSSGLGEAISGVDRIADGLEQIDGGLAQFEAGLEAQPGDLDRLETGVGAMIAGLDRILPGLGELQQGLARGSQLIRSSGLIPEPGDDIAVTASVANAFPKLRRQLSFFTDESDRATRLFVILERQPYDPQALTAADDIREVAQLSLRESALRADRLAVTGASPFFADIEDVTSDDVRVIVFAVILGVFLVLAALLRSLLAPLYLVLTVLLSFASTLGLTSLVFENLLGEDGLVWWLPIFLFVTLVALGADYNIFLMGRIREEAGRMDTRHAVAEGLAATGHVITSAGLILAGTFAALLAAPLDGMVQLGFSATLGLLLDTFIVRSLMVPAIAVLVGPASWWPSARARRA